jgi:hypothetical protein
MLAGSALGAAARPHFSVHSAAIPSKFSEANNARCEGDLLNELVRVCDTYEITVTNNGAVKTDGTAVTIEDVLPPGLQARGIALFRVGPQVTTEKRGKEPVAAGCTLVPLTCKFRSEKIEGTLRTGALKPDEALEMRVYVTVSAGASGSVTNSASVSGGGAPATSTTSTNEISAEESSPFGTSLGAEITGLDGTPETQAGGHPYEFTTRFDLNSEIRHSPESQLIATSSEDLKDAVIELPLGFVGSATAAPTCTFAQLVSLVGCPPASRIGYINTEPEGSASANSWIYNMLPEHGVAAEFGFTDVLNNTHAVYATVVPTPAGYVIRATAHEVPQIALTDVISSFFGNPVERNGGAGPAAAFFTAPSDCSGEPLTTRLYADTWQKPARFGADGAPDLSDPNWNTSTSQTPAVTNCEALQERFQPTISAQPSNSQADSPTGLDVNIKVPQDQSPEVLGVPPLKKAVVTLPRGMTVNASSANGLEACSLAQIGISVSGEPNSAQPTCPQASKIGTVELETPALSSEVCREATKNLAECPGESEREKVPLKGSIFLARQSENPFGSLLAIYIVVDDARTGVLVKLAGEVKADPNTGQLTTVVDNSPQFPFSELRTHFFSGDAASLATPAACGSYAVSSELTPWSAAQSGGPAATPSGGFAITQGAGGGACANPFTPSFAAATAQTQAAGFTPFRVSFSRSDADQQLSGLSVTTPPGLLGVLKSVTRCPEPQAAHGECGPESLIGETSAAVGTGPSPYWVTGGKVYLTGPYNGGPFGLSIVVPTTAGPFTLTGNGGPGREIVRASIRVNPETAQITVLSDPLPRILEGIPLEIRTVQVTIDRPGFMFNPTNCNQLSSSAALTSTQAASATAQSPFQATGCKALAFKPSLTATTNAKTSKANGASLKVAISYPAGGEADISRVDLEIPKILPTRLTTIQKACTEQQFSANPASCPSASVIATAIVHTPLLASPLAGPAYFVSHGNAAFPDVEMVLQGEGITLVVDGKTQIKNGATFSHFETVPDAPFSSFEFNAPQGPYSIFTANGDLCAAPIKIPVKLTGQNGAVLSLNSNVAVTDCPNVLKILSHKVKGRKVTLKVSVPGAGRLTASGRGLTKVRKTVKAKGTVTFTLKAKGRGKLKSKVKLAFVPSAKGSKSLARSLAVKVPRAR